MNIFTQISIKDKLFKINKNIEKTFKKNDKIKNNIHIKVIL